MNKIKALGPKPPRTLTIKEAKEIIKNSDNFKVVDSYRYISEILTRKDITNLYENENASHICDFIQDKVFKTSVICIKGKTVKLINSELFLGAI